MTTKDAYVSGGCAGEESDTFHLLLLFACYIYSPLFANCVYVNMKLCSGLWKDPTKQLYALIQAENEEPKSSNPPSSDPNATNCSSPSKFHLSVKDDSSLPARVLAIPQHIRKWTKLEVNSDVLVTPFAFDVPGDEDSGDSISTVFLEVDFESRGKQMDTISFCSDSLAAEFRKQFNHNVFSFGQEVFFEFSGKNTRKRSFQLISTEEDKENGINPLKEKVMFSAVVKQLFSTCFAATEAVHLHELDFGLLKQESAIVFVPAKNSSLSLYGSNTIKSQPPSVEDKPTDSKLEAEPAKAELADAKDGSSSTASTDSTTTTAASTTTTSHTKKACPNKDITLTLIDIPTGSPASSSTKDHRILLNSADYNITEYGSNITISYGADSRRMVLGAVNSDLYIPKGQVALGKAVAEETGFEVGAQVVINQTSKEDNKTVAKTLVVDFSAYANVQKPQKSINNRFVSKNKSNYVKLDEKYKPKDVCATSSLLGGSEATSYLSYKVVLITLTTLEGTSQTNLEDADFAVCRTDTIIKIKCSDKSISFFGSSQEDEGSESLINFDWDFQKMGIGGLDKQFSEIFRRAFASRLVNEKCRQEMGINHLRGVILHGPPGTGKTLLARKIAEMLNAREPKIVNGPEIFGMYVGQSEMNIRNLFLDAEKEYACVGDKSKLHVIIFDEFDSICPNRQKILNSGRTDSRVVNQLLSKIDGVDQLNNILIIGMTNQLDLIDPAILRPGRMEVQLQIHLPDEDGRLQILNIHTQKMRSHNRLDTSVDLAQIAKQTPNYSGAELEVFGNATAALNHILHRPLITWCPEIDDILSKGDEAIQQTIAKSGSGFVRVLLVGAKFTGKTFLAANIAKKSAFPFINILTPTSIGTDKLKKLDSVFADAKASPLSCLVLDNLERIADYAEADKSFNRDVVSKLNDLLEKRPPEGKRLLVLATCSSAEFIQEMKLKNIFNYVLEVPSINKPEHISKVVVSVNAFTAEEMPLFQNHLSNLPTHIELGIKQIFELLDAIPSNQKETEEKTPTGQPNLVKSNDEHKKRVAKFFKGLEEVLLQVPVHFNMYA
uniref:AAA+ ATPase domain-containing protein n=1 Tax=Ditylenchus dipsaci TaxID=166011 RepID=A0A915DFK7_9BILA